MVAAGHTATAEAGAAILRQGGNAVDAAIAAIATSFTAEPVLTAAGGGGFMLVSAGAGRPVMYDGFARMPSGRTHSPELKPIPVDFGDSVQIFHIGQASIGTPSLMAMLFQAHRDHGRLPLREVLAPGIEAARSGIRLNRLQASFMGLLHKILTDSRGAMELYAPAREGQEAGRLLQPEEQFRNPDLANTMEMLAMEGIEEMYQGDLARAIVSASLPHGLLSMDDMRTRQVYRRTPLSTHFMGGTLLTNPAPSAGGLLIVFAAAVLDRLMQMPATAGTPWPVLMTECLHAASSLRNDALHRRMQQPDVAAELLTPKRFAQAVRHIRLRLSGESGEFPGEAANRHGSTTHISVVDRQGMAVSATTSNGEGSGIVVPSTGIHLNNMLGEEDINPLGFHKLAAGATLPSMMAPSIFFADGRPAMVLGSGGSNRLRGAILQTLVRHRLLGQDIETAVQAPRLHNEGQSLDVEPGLLNRQEYELLTGLGWKLNEWRQQSIYFGGVHAIAADAGGNMQAAGDPRRGGAVAWA